MINVDDVLRPDGECCLGGRLCATEDGRDSCRRERSHPAKREMQTKLLQKVRKQPLLILTILVSMPPTVRKIAYSALYHVSQQEEHYSYNRAHSKSFAPIEAISAVQPFERLEYDVECTKSVRDNHEGDSGDPYMDIAWCWVWYVAAGSKLGSHPASEVYSVDLVVVFAVEQYIELFPNVVIELECIHDRVELHSKSG